MSKQHLERKDFSRRAVAGFPFGSSVAGYGSDLRDQFRRMFSDFAAPRFVTAFGWAPAVDIAESTDELTLTAELPGVDKHDLHVTLRADVLTIKGEKRDETTAESTQYHVFERSYGAFTRSFTLPNTIDEKQIKAEFDDGVLTVHLPKSAEVTRATKTIEVTD